MLVLTRKENESILIDGGRITLTILKIRGNQISLGIQAPKEVSVLRAELEMQVSGPAGRRKRGPLAGHSTVASLDGKGKVTVQPNSVRGPTGQHRKAFVLPL
jgi:carbon storage regulator